jgi:hypothetical protein
MLDHILKDVNTKYTVKSTKEQTSILENINGRRKE